METDIPTTVTGGNTGGLSFEQKVGLILPLFILVVLGILTFLFSRSRFKNAFYFCLRKCCPGCQRSADERTETSQNASERQSLTITHEIVMSTRNAGGPESEINVLAQSPNQAALNAPSEEADGSAGGDQSSQSDQADRTGLSEGGQRSADVEDHQSPNHQAEIPETSEVAEEQLIGQSPDQIEMSTMRAGAPEPESEANSPNQAVLNPSSEEADESAGGDQSSQSDQADSTGLSEGCGDGQAVEAENRDMATSDPEFYDIYLVSTSKHTPHLQKMKDMCKKNGWKFTTPFSGKLGAPVMESAEEAVLTCSHVVLVITKDDCAMEEVEFNMTIEMAFDSFKNNKIIPIRCCDEKSLPPRLKRLHGSSIDDDDLEERMIETIDKGIRKKREAQCYSVSGAPGGRDGADVADGSDNASGMKTVLTDIFFMNLAQKIGSEWRHLAIRLGIDTSEIERIIEDERYTKNRIQHILICWRQRTQIKNDREKVEVLCNVLIKCNRHDLSEQVQSGAIESS